MHRLLFMYNLCTKLILMLKCTCLPLFWEGDILLVYFSLWDYCDIDCRLFFTLDFYSCCNTHVLYFVLTLSPWPSVDVLVNWIMGEGRECVAWRRPTNKPPPMPKCPWVASRSMLRWLCPCHREIMDLLLSKQIQFLLCSSSLILSLKNVVYQVYLITYSYLDCWCICSWFFSRSNAPAWF